LARVGELVQLQVSFENARPEQLRSQC
jgi:hypothetical protein